MRNVLRALRPFGAAHLSFWRDCQEFRVQRGVMGNKETPYVTTERTLDTERHSRPAAGRH